MNAVDLHHHKMRQHLWPGKGEKEEVFEITTKEKDKRKRQTGQQQASGERKNQSLAVIRHCRARFLDVFHAASLTQGLVAVKLRFATFTLGQMVETTLSHPSRKKTRTQRGWGTRFP